MKNFQLLINLILVAGGLLITSFGFKLVRYLFWGLLIIMSIILTTQNDFNPFMNILLVAIAELILPYLLIFLVVFWDRERFR